MFTETSCNLMLRDQPTDLYVHFVTFVTSLVPLAIAAHACITCQPTRGGIDPHLPSLLSLHKGLFICPICPRYHSTKEFIIQCKTNPPSPVASTKPTCIWAASQHMGDSAHPFSCAGQNAITHTYEHVLPMPSSLLHCATEYAPSSYQTYLTVHRQ